MATMSKQVKPPSPDHNNPDLLVWACFVAGGYERWLDVEELYLKAFELAPARLGWRTRGDLPDYKKCAKALQEVEDPKRSAHLGLFLKNGRYLRKLSDSGHEWCHTYSHILMVLYGGGLVPAPQTSVSTQALSTLKRSPAYTEYLKSGDVSCEMWMLAEALQCLPDSPRAVWLARLDQVSSTLRVSDDKQAASFVKKVRSRIEVEVRS
jgi:hypothetical protein